MKLETGIDIWMLSLEDTQPPRPFVQTKAIEWWPVFSSNGRWVAYGSDESGRFEIYVTPFPGRGGKWTVSTEGGTHPLWNPNGGELFYVNGDKMMVVDVETEGEISLGKPRVLFERRLFGSGDPSRQYDVTRDSQRFVMIEETESAPPPTHLNIVLNWSEELKRLVPTEN